MISKKIEKELKEKYKNEEVYVLPYKCVSSIPDGFTKSSDKNIFTKFDTLGIYTFRYDAEYNNSMIQIIPYCIIRKNDKIFLGERLAGDNRLVHSHTIGWGGHINPVDGSNEILLHALSRELEEELFFKAKSRAKFLGYIRDLNSKTSEHLGCVFILDVSSCYVLEKDNLKGKWASIDDLKKDYFNHESWSQLCINFLYTQQLNNKAK